MLAIEAVTNLSTNANYIKIFSYKPKNSRLNILLRNIQQLRSHLNKFRAKKKNRLLWLQIPSQDVL